MEKRNSRDEIIQGIGEYNKERADEMDYGFQLRKPKIIPGESIINFNIGLKKAEIIITTLKGDFIGAKYCKNFYGYETNQIMTIEKAGLDTIIEKLACEGWYPLYDDSLESNGHSSGDGSSFVYYIGDKEIYSFHYSRNFDAEKFYYVAGRPVTREDYYEFREAVGKMLEKNYQDRNAEKDYSRKLPKDIKDKIDKEKHDRRTDHVLKNGTIVPSGKVEFKHGPYGCSGGSGGGYGSVNAFVLSAWKNGERIKKEISTESRDNGFCAGPISASIEPDTIIIAKGGDCMDWEGRSWEEIYICE